MKNIIRIAAALVCAAALSVPLSSCARAGDSSASSSDSDMQASVSPAPGAYHRRRSPFFRALHELTLTDAQKAQIKGFMSAAKQADVNATPDERRANGKKLHDQILGVLTPEQRQQVETEMAREKRMHHKGHMSPSPMEGEASAAP